MKPVHSGMLVKLAGGITIPLSKTKGTGAPSHCADKDFKKEQYYKAIIEKNDSRRHTWSCIHNSFWSLGDKCGHMVCRRNVVCLVAKAECPIRLAATTSSCSSCICKEGQPKSKH